MSAEVTLFRAIIYRAINDALGIFDGESPYEQRLAKSSARAWFRWAEAHYRMICSEADIDPDALRRHVLQLIKEHDASGTRKARKKMAGYTVSRPRSQRALSPASEAAEA